MFEVPLISMLLMVCAYIRGALMSVLLLLLCMHNLDECVLPRIAR